MSNEPIKPQLIDMLNHGYADETQMIASLSDAQRAEEGTLTHWSVKDLVSHLNYWRGLMLMRLQALQRGEMPISTPNFLELNDENFQATRYLTWAETLESSQRTLDDLISIVESFSENDLTDPERYEWRRGEALWTIIRSNAYDHPEAHIAQYYFEQGNHAKAMELQSQLADLISRVDPSPRSRGTAIYNFACFLALNGEPTKAIENLRESFILRPDLLEFSKEDPDLNSLRELSEYRALFQPA